MTRSVEAEGYWLLWLNGTQTEQDFRSWHPEATEEQVKAFLEWLGTNLDV